MSDNLTKILQYLKNSYKPTHLTETIFIQVIELPSLQSLEIFSRFASLISHHPPRAEYEPQQRFVVNSLHYRVAGCNIFICKKPRRKIEQKQMYV